MSSIATPQGSARIGRLERIWKEPSGVLGWVTTVDHKRIGLMYFFTAIAFFAAGGVEALLIRTQLSGPNLHVLGPVAYDQAFTMHGITMIFLFVIPMTTGAFGNYLVPLMIGARDMAFPRMNALGYWIYAASGIFVYVGLAVGHAPSAGWFNYVPLADKAYSPDAGVDFYALGLIFNGISSTMVAVNFIVTIFRLRAPGMSLNRMPLFCYAYLAVSFALLFALPPLNVSLMFLELNRQLGFEFYNVAGGGDPLLWQHLFWIFGHPEVYIIILPAFGIATSIIPTFVRRHMVAFPLVALSELLVAFIGFGVWAHHMFAVGLSTIASVYFAAASLIIVIPSGIQLFAWCTTIATGTPSFRTPLLYIVGFIVMFLLGGLSGVMFAAIPFDQQLTDTYFVVAHFHFVIFGAAVFPILGGMFYWFPKVSGRMYFERWGKVSFWLVFIGTTLTFFPMHIVGLLGMPRRAYTYHGGLGWTGWNLLESIGSYILAVGLIAVVANLVVSLRKGERVGNDPFGGETLEWSVSSPPPSYNFAVIPRVSSAYAMWDREDREEDARRLDRGEQVLSEGHETPATTALDADWDAVLGMPPSSPWPPVLALMLAGTFGALLLHHYVLAALFVGLAGLVLVAWHSKPSAVHLVDRARQAIPNGVWGMSLGLAAEVALFGSVLASYFYLRFQNSSWPPAGIDPPSVTAPLVLTGVLLLSTIPMALAVRAGDMGRKRLWLFAVLAIYVIYLGWQIHLFGHDLHDFSPSRTAYGSIYFTMLALHHAHVLVGIALVAWAIAATRPVAVRAIGVYVYVVNVLAIFVVLTQLSPSL